MLHKYALCTSGGIATAILTYKILIFHDKYNNRTYENFYSVYGNIKDDIIQKLIGTTIGFFAGAIITSKLIKS